MRKLLFIPIIHNEADLGSLGPAMQKRSAALYGEDVWTVHNETVAKFWQSIADHLMSLDATNLKIYQDGLPVDGDLARRIIEGAAEKGSTNHQIILQLSNKGAEVRRTEDISLLGEELKLALEEASSENVPIPEIDLRREQLTEERDRFISKTIDETLQPGETGLLFMGAYHNVHNHLPRDIIVEQIKDQEQVKAYFQCLISGKGDRLEHLAQQMTAPIITSR
ncbi:MAG: hypothetical protein HQ553_14420 [Chloroflexi bacterium]|nr:hypothetical protein [Chloroflexota bacterium]